ncbi:hypothetical protein FACS1894211_06490 [Clostridia bacterium]|nr:hypothetical protein FACS1894211_06490 [Clostridia bacterium]
MIKLSVFEELHKFIEGGELHVSIHTIRKAVRRLLNEFDTTILTQPKRVEVEELVEQLGFHLRYESLSRGIEILGVTCFGTMNIPVVSSDTGSKEPRLISANTVVINSLLLDEKYKGRYAYTVAHEIGHIVFDNLKMREAKQASRQEMLEQLADGDGLSVSAFLAKHKKEDDERLRQEEKRVERVCDNFAACLLLPDETVEMLIREEICKYRPANASNCLYIHGGEDDVKFVKGLIDKISELYGASRETTVYKVRDTRLIRGAGDILEVLMKNNYGFT